MGAGFPEQVVSILRMDNAALTHHQKSLVMASFQNSLKFERASADMRRLFGSCGSGRKQGALITEKAAESNVRYEGLDILAATRKARKQGLGKTKGDSSLKAGGDKVKGDGQTSKASNRKTGRRKTCYRCDNEYHLPPRCPWRDVPRREVRPFSQESVRPT